MYVYILHKYTKKSYIYTYAQKTHRKTTTIKTTDKTYMEKEG